MGSGGKSTVASIGRARGFVEGFDVGGVVERGGFVASGGIAEDLLDDDSLDAEAAAEEFEKKAFVPAQVD